MNKNDRFTNVGGHDFDKILKNVTKDLVWVEYETETGAISYPFWKSMMSGKDSTYQDFLDWMKLQKAAKMSKDLTGIVKPKADFDSDSTTKPTLVDNYKSHIEDNVKKLSKVPKLKEFEDKTGDVKPKADMGTQSKISVPKPSKLKSEPKDNTGAVEVKKADFGKKTKQIVDNDVSVPKDSKADLKTVQKPGKGDLTGIVEPKADMGTQRKVDVTDAPKPKKGELEDMTGVVDPKTTFGGKAKPEFDHDYTKPFNPIVLGWDAVMDQFNSIMPD